MKKLMNKQIIDNLINHFIIYQFFFFFKINFMFYIISIIDNRIIDMKGF